MIESVQYNAALYHELGLESLHDRRWYRKLCFCYKIKHNDCPLYLTELLPNVKSSGYSLRSNQSLYYSRTERFEASFFPSSTYNWNKLDIYTWALLKFIRHTSANVYKIHHPRGLKLLTRLWLGLSHLREHKFRHNFNDTIDPFCLCRTNRPEAQWGRCQLLREFTSPTFFGQLLHAYFEFGCWSCCGGGVFELSPIVHQGVKSQNIALFKIGLSNLTSNIYISMMV